MNREVNPHAESSVNRHRVLEDDDWIEVNLDRVVGPTHHFGGLGVGNLASLQHAGRVANPRAAAIQGIEKMRLCTSLGGYQLVLPPQQRPALRLLGQLGFSGTPQEMLRQAYETSPALLSAAWSDSAMWTANAATVSPACDCSDSRTHLTIANLTSSLHRSLEPTITLHQVRSLFRDLDFAVHRPLPATSVLRDEGAANHMRLCDTSGRLGLNIFVYGCDPLSGESDGHTEGRFPARQSRAACEAISRRHRLAPENTFMLHQHPQAVASGAFHNDVVATSCYNVLLYHELAFADAQPSLEAIEKRFTELTGERLWRYEIPQSALSLAEAVDCYLFNSQMIPDWRPPHRITLVCPIQVQASPRAEAIVNSLLSDDGPIAAVRYVDLTQSMNNGGGPACLRLRVQMTRQQWLSLPQQVRFSESLAQDLLEIIHRTYPQRMTVRDLADHEQLVAAQLATAAINQHLGFLDSLPKRDQVAI